MDCCCPDKQAQARPVFDETGFRLRFPAFADTAKFPLPMLERHFDMAQLHIPGGRRIASILGMLWELLTAHLVQLETALASGNPAGLLQSATIDKTSVTLVPPPAKNQLEYWFNLTPYGAQALLLLKQRAAGGLFVGGSPAERDAFRKAGGVFTKRSV